MMDQEEALRLTRLCLPAILQASKEDSVSETTTIAACHVKQTTLCRVWAGVGYVYEISLFGNKYKFIVKKVVVSASSSAKYLSLGDARKAHSYTVEANFYENVAPFLTQKGLLIPQPFHLERDDHSNKVVICMSKLNGRSSGLTNMQENKAVLKWLATLHAATWGYNDEAYAGLLQPVASYWHLDTRPDEHESMPTKGWEGRLRRAARAIDSRLKRDKMQCMCHGDAKDANMIWPQNEEVKVAFCDFQYCGKSPPTVDLAYFLCVAAVDVEKNEQYLVQYYFNELCRQLLPLNLGDDELPSLVDLTQSLSIAYCDFARFMSGWGWWGNDLSSKVISVLDMLDGGRDLGSEEAYDKAIRLHFG